MIRDDLTPFEVLGSTLARHRRRLDLNQAEIARQAFVAQSVVSESEHGKRLAPWGLVDAICDELDEHGAGDQASALRQLRSRIEAPHLGEPGTVALCLNTVDRLADWHWVRRKPGQLLCPDHETDFGLIGKCPECEFEFSRIGDRTRICVGCGLPIGALQQYVLYDKCPILIEAIERHLQEAQAALKEQGIEPIVVDSTDRTPDDRIRNHNETIEKVEEGQLRGRELSHYKAAKSLAESGKTTFTRSEFVREYLNLVNGSNETHALPSDYRLGVKRSGRKNSWFLMRQGRNSYEFVGLDGVGDGLSEELAES